MATLGDAKVSIRANLKPLRKGLMRAKAMVTKSMISLSKTSFRLVGNVIKSTMRSILTSVKRLVRLFAVAFTAVLFGSIKALISFQKQMANVSTMLTEQTLHFIPEYSRAILDMTATFGVSSKTLSDALYNILSASIAAKDAIRTLNVVSKAASAGLTEVSTAAFAITGILNAYGMSADKAGKISDILFATVKRGQTTFEQLAPSVGRVTAIAASAGVKFEEVAAALATITRGGISTDEAVTALRMTLISLQGQTDEAVKIGKEHGITLSVEALKTKGLIGMMQQLKKLNPEVLKDMFKEIRARIGINVLLKDSAGLLSDYELAMNSAGLTEEAFRKQSATLGFQLSRTNQIIRKAAYFIGNIFASDVAKINTAMQNWLNNNMETITEWAAVVKEKLQIAVDYFTDLLDIIKDKGWSSALDKIGADIKKAFEITLKFLTPIAEKIGAAMARGFVTGIFAMAKGVIVKKGGFSTKGAVGLTAAGAVAGGLIAGPGGATVGAGVGAGVAVVSTLNSILKSVLTVVAMGQRDSRIRLQLSQTGAMNNGGF